MERKPWRTFAILALVVMFSLMFIVLKFSPGGENIFSGVSILCISICAGVLATALHVAFSDHKTPDETVAKFDHSYLHLAFAKATAVFLVIAVLSYIAINYYVEAREANSPKGFQKTQFPDGRMNLDRQAVERISETCRDGPKLTSIFGKMIGISPFGKLEKDDVCKPLKEYLGRLDGNNGILRTQKQLAEAAAVSAMISLGEIGDILPQYSHPDDVKGRITQLLRCYDTLYAAGESIRQDTLYLSILHARFSIVRTAQMMIANSEGVINFDDHVTADLAARLAVVNREIGLAKHRDGLIYFDDIGTRVLLSPSMEDWKSGFRECSRLIENPPASSLCHPESLKLRLHILRLKLYHIISINSLANCKPNEKSGKEDDVRGLAKSGNTGRPPSNTLIDESIGFVHEFSALNHDSETMATIWADSVFVMYYELAALFDNQCPWNRDRLQTSIEAHLNQSRKLISRLRKADELSPDYLLAAIKLHIYAESRFMQRGDLAGYKALLDTGLSYVQDLIDNKFVLHTPLRTPPPPKEPFTTQSWEYGYFKTRLEKINK